MMNLRSSSVRLLLGGSIAIIGMAAASVPAVASTASTTFNVTATVQATCLISASNLGFGFPRTLNFGFVKRRDDSRSGTWQRITGEAHAKE